jgi:quercetin dioxygenase-like cupin family protein
MPFFRVEDQERILMLPGIRRSAVWLEHVMLTFFTFEPESIVPEHAHENEQITLVTRGAMEFTLDGQTRLLRSGEGACIPSHVRHSARILEESTEAIDAWAPPRADYKT